MVCQGASQTRFRALKHENGIAGKATIIVRVIACFQPLQDCQVLFRLMFGTNGSWQHSTLESPAFRDCMIAPTEIRQHEFLPAYVNPCRLSANLGFNEFGLCGWPGRGLMSEGNGMFANSMPYSQSILAPNSRPEEQISVFSPREGEKPGAIEAPCHQQRKFLVFDQSGDETRLMFRAACPQVPVMHNVSPFWNPVVASAQLFDTSAFAVERQAGIMQNACTKTIPHEESGENEIIGEESEMREDTEEINALLYSHDDSCDEDDDDDDEVSSGHSPPLAGVGIWQSQEEQNEKDFGDGVACSSTSLKRRKILDGKHEKLALKDTTTTGLQDLVCENIHDGDVICSLDDGEAPTVGSKRSRKDKIRDTLKVLERIIPGVKNKDPVVILDEAISYLKSLKCTAEIISAEDSDTSGCYDLLY